MEKYPLEDYINSENKRIYISSIKSIRTNALDRINGRKSPYLKLVCENEFDTLDLFR